MPLQPGPLFLQPDELVQSTPGVYDFASDADKLAKSLDAVSHGWEELMPSIESLATDPLGDLDQIDIVGIVGAVHIGSAASEFPTLDDAVQTFPLADDQLRQALSFAPPAAWADPPLPFVPPDEFLNLTAPTIPVDSYRPNTTGLIGAAPLAVRPDVELENLTRFGASNFVVGDKFKLLVLGFENQTITVSITKNGELLPTGTLGVIGPLGDYVVEGTMGPEFQGVWTYAVFLDSRLVRTFSFVVTGDLL